MEIISCHEDHIDRHHYSIFNIQTNKESMAIPIIMLIYIVKHIEQKLAKTFKFGLLSPKKIQSDVALIILIMENVFYPSRTVITEVYVM